MNSGAIGSVGAPLNSGDSSESSTSAVDRSSVGRWRKSIPNSWKKQNTPQVDVVYSYDAETDVHSFNPMVNGVVEDVDHNNKARLVVKTATGIRTVPIVVPMEESEGISELHTVATQTDELERHGLTELWIVKTIVDE